MDDVVYRLRSELGEGQDPESANLVELSEGVPLTVSASQRTDEILRMLNDIGSPDASCVAEEVATLAKELDAIIVMLYQYEYGMKVLNTIEKIACRDS